MKRSGIAVRCGALLYGFFGWFPIGQVSNVAASTQNQALSAILFLYKEVLQQELELQVDAVRAKRSRYVPTVLTREEVLAIINHLSGIYQLIVDLYSCFKSRG